MQDTARVLVGNKVLFMGFEAVDHQRSWLYCACFLSPMAVVVGFLTAQE